MSTFNLSPSQHYALNLGTLCAVAGFLIFASAQLTDPIIARNLYQDQLRSVERIMPADYYVGSPFDDQTQLLIANENSTLYKTHNADQTLRGYLIATQVQGYSGAIRLLIALDVSGEILGVEVISHSETPGLGDKIERNKSDWLLQFTHKTLNELTQAQWGVKKDGGVFDQFSGATITPRAIVKQIHAALIALDTGVSADEH